MRNDLILSTDVPFNDAYKHDCSKHSCFPSKRAALERADEVSLSLSFSQAAITVLRASKVDGTLNAIAEPVQIDQYSWRRRVITILTTVFRRASRREAEKQTLRSIDAKRKTSLQ